MTCSNFWKTNAQCLPLWLFQTQLPRVSHWTVLSTEHGLILLWQGKAGGKPGINYRRNSKNPNAAPKEHNEDCQRRVAQMDNDQKRQTTFRESSKVISFFILPFLHTWVQFFLLKNKMIHETHLPLLFTISRGQLAGYYENFYRSFNHPWKLSWFEGNI